MKNLVYARFDEMTVNEVSELMRIASGKMAINVVSVAPTLFRVSAYGIFDGDAEDWGLRECRLRNVPGRRGVRGNQEVVRD
jgi:hypothetical protein